MRYPIERMPFLAFIIAPDKKVLDKLNLRGGRIRCPVCQWQPAPTDTWCCSPGCLHVWNTFETRGLCPGCSKQWTHTACLRCNAWSLHDDWYEES